MRAERTETATPLRVVGWARGHRLARPDRSGGSWAIVRAGTRGPWAVTRAGIVLLVAEGLVTTTNEDSGAGP